MKVTTPKNKVLSSKLVCLFFGLIPASCGVVYNPADILDIFSLKVSKKYQMSTPNIFLCVRAQQKMLCEKFAT